jgi:hypothetical protein
MGNKVRLSKKVKINKVKCICRMYSEGEFTIATCCEATGIKYDTFKEWVQPSLSEEAIAIGNYRRGFIREAHLLYQKASIQNTINYKELLKNKTRSGILMRVTGTKVTETQTETRIDNDGSARIALVRKAEKFIPPDTTMLMFVAKSLNLFPVISLQTNNNVVINNLHLLTDEELKKRRVELEKALLSDQDC